MKLGVEKNLLLKRNCPHLRPNISQEETKAIKDFMDDSSMVIITVNKGVAMVVMDKQDYLNKTQQLLTDTYTYKPISKNPISRLKTSWHKL